jgi:hypothetical protein
MIVVQGVFFIGSSGLRLWLYRFRSIDLVSSTLDLIVFFGQSVSFEGMSTMLCSFIATCGDFVLFCFLFYFIFLSWPSG